MDALRAASPPSPPALAARVHVVCAVAIVALGVRSAPQQGWHLPLLLSLVGFAAISDVMGVETESVRVKVSGSFLAIVVALVLLGGVSGAIVGVATIAFGWFRWREAGHYFRNNLITYAAFPLLTGIAFHRIRDGLDLKPADPAFYVLVMGAFALALVLNFTMVAGYQCLIDGDRLLAKARSALAPLLSSELASALLCVCTVFAYERLGAVAVVMIGAVIFIFQYLVGQLLVSQQRGKRLQAQAVTDHLTGLPNRALLLSRLRENIAAGKPHALMLMDLDGFKEVNDTLGHDYGDDLLAAVGGRLSSVFADIGLVARLGGDEFSVIVDGERTTEELRGLTGELLRCLEQPTEVQGMTFEVSASIGIVRFPDDGADPQLLLRRADVAMYNAKREGGACEFYVHGRDPHTPRRLQLLNDLRRGIRAGELFLEFQPEVDIASARTRGAEALVRWQHPELGRLPPVEFVGLAESSGLIKSLTEDVMDRALAHATDWRDRGFDLQIAVNLSARVLGQRGLPDQIAAQLANAGAEPELLTLEITESMFIGDPARALATLNTLHEMGIDISIDDFGTGYSSLAYLKRLPITELKVDRSFISSMLEDDTDAIIVRSTVDLAHSLGLRAVAEGVEDEVTLDRLRDLGCDVAQGYHLSRPVAPDAFITWVEDRQRRWSTLEVPRAPELAVPSSADPALSDALAAQFGRSAG